MGDEVVRAGMEGMHKVREHKGKVKGQRGGRGKVMVCQDPVDAPRECGEPATPVLGGRHEGGGRRVEWTAGKEVCGRRKE